MTTHWRSIRTRMMAGSLSTVLAITSVQSLVGCSGAPPSSTGVRVDRQQLDGKTIFQGIFFGQGDVAAMFPEVWQRPEYRSAQHLTPTQSAKLGELTRTIDAQHPGFFDRFANEVKSGDHLRVRAALQEATLDIQPLVSDTELGGTRGECFGIIVAGVFLLVVVAQFVIYQTSAVTSNTNYTSTCGAAPTCGGGPPSTCVSTCVGTSGGIAYHGSDGVLGGDPAASPVPDAGAGLAAAETESKSSLADDEYVALIAWRLGPNAHL
jgi:SdpC family antimicrobial peptide